MPLVIVTDALPDPLPLHDPLVVISTALPDAPPVAATLKLVPKIAVAGAAVVTVIACRNMWLSAQETMKRLIADAGGELRDNVVFTDRGSTLASFITTPRWLLTGRRDAFWGLPAAGVADADIAGGERSGTIFSVAIQA